MNQVLFITPDNSPLAATARLMAEAGSNVRVNSTVQDTVQYLKSSRISNIATALILADPSVGVRIARRRLAEAGFDIPVLSAEPQNTALPARDNALRNDQSSPRALIGRPLVEVERELIIETLKACGGNRTRTSNLLGISIRTMRNKIRQYATQGIDVPAPPSVSDTPLDIANRNPSSDTGEPHR